MGVEAKDYSEPQGNMEQLTSLTVTNLGGNLELNLAGNNKKEVKIRLKDATTVSVKSMLEASRKLSKAGVDLDNGKTLDVLAGCNIPVVEALVLKILQIHWKRGEAHDAAYTLYRSTKDKRIKAKAKRLREHL